MQKDNKSIKRDKKGHRPLGFGNASVSGVINKVRSFLPLISNVSGAGT